MDSKIITFGGQETPFKGIDRTAASNDSNPGSARVIKDMEILPVGKLKMREEYDALYDNRPSQYEHTTNDTANEQLVAAITDTHLNYRSHRRKNVAVTNNGTTEYVFTGYVEASASQNDTQLLVHRGTRATTATDAAFPAVVDPLVICSVHDIAANHYNINDWIEFSMVASMSSGVTTTHALYFAVTLYDSVAGLTEVRFIKVLNIYAADFSALVPDIVEVGLNSYIQQNDAITRDLDIEIGVAGVGDGDYASYNGDRLFFFWGYDAAGGTDAVVKYTSTADLTDIDTYTETADAFAISVVRDTNEAQNLMYLCYTLNVGAADKLKIIAFMNSAVPANKIATSGSAVSIASDVYDGVSADFYYGACMAVDNDGAVHFLYRSAERTLTHVYYTGVLGTAVNITVSLNNGTNEILNTCWDFVVKDKLVTVFYNTSTTEHIIHKSVGIIDATDEDYNSGTFYSRELVRIDTSTYDTIRYFSCYRKYEANTSKRLSYMIGTDATTAVTCRYLHEDKGFFDADFDGNITDAADRQVSIEKLGEPLVADADGVMTQILILQCNDDKLYKRGNYQWELLEGQRNVNNTGWNWTTAFGDGCHQIWDLNGTVRFNAGSGSTNLNAWYGYINRDYFVNTTNSYTDHYSEHARLDPPATANIVAITETAYAAPLIGYTGFTTQHGAGLPQIFSPYLPPVGDHPSGLYAEFFFGFTFEYDGWQESQIRLQSGDDPYRVGFVPPYMAENNVWVIKIDLQLPIWNKATSPLNGRITAVNIHAGQKMIAEDTKLTVAYNFVKHVTVSGNVVTGETVFSGTATADDIKGTKTWTVNGGDATLYDITVYYDYLNWLNRTESKTQFGNSNFIYESTGSGAEPNPIIYTKECFIPEGYKYSITLNDEVYVANIRLAGVTRENRIMRSARKLDSYVTPDHLTDAIGTYADLPYSIYGLSKVGDKTLLVLGSNGVDVFDVSSGMLSRVDEAINIGTTSPTSVTEIIEGGLGQILRGTIYKDVDGHIRLCDVYGAPIISDPIRDDHDTTFRGCEYLHDQSYAANFAYMPLYQKLIMAYDTGSKTAIFVFDLKRGLKDFYYWEWTDRLKALAVGVDGELFWTDSAQVMIYPQAGTRDEPDPQWRSQNITFPDEIRMLAKKVWGDYICTGTTLQPYVYKDGTETAATNVLAVAATQTRDMTGFAFGTASLREVGFGIKTTTPANATSLEIDKIAFELSMVRRRPQ